MRQKSSRSVKLKRRTRSLKVRLSDAEHALLSEKATRASLPMASLVRDHISRVTVRNREDEKQRLMLLNRINANLNMVAKWCNYHKSAAESVEVIAQLCAVERSLLNLLERIER